MSRLVAILEKKLGGRFPAPKPALSLASKPRPQPARRFDSVTRSSHLDRIRYLARGYGLGWLIDQATFDRPGLESLDDDEIVKLHRDMDRAMECLREGVAFVDAELVRPLTQQGCDDEMDSWGDPEMRLAG